MLPKLAAAGLAIAGVINLLPVSGALGAAWLRSLYGFDVAAPDLEVLLRHRALLFGMLGVLLLSAVLKPSLRGVAIALAGFSMASFIVVALIVGGYGPAITKIIIADIAGLIALIPAVITRFSSSSQ